MKYKRFNPELVSVFVKDGHHFLVTPCGHEIKGLTGTMVSDSVDMPATVSADIFVNLVSTKEEAMKKYSNDKPCIESTINGRKLASIIDNINVNKS